MGNGYFRPPQNRHPSTDHQKICHRWLCRRPLRLCQIRCISVYGGLLGIWVKYNHNYFSLCPFFGNSPTGQTHRWIFTHDGSKDADSRKDVPFGGFFHIAPHLGGQKPPKPLNFGAWIGVFKPNSRNRKTVRIIKTTAWIPTKFCTKIKTTKCTSWVVPTHALNAAILEKSKNCYISAVVRAILTKFGMRMQFDPPDRPDC